LQVSALGKLRLWPTNTCDVVAGSIPLKSRRIGNTQFLPKKEGISKLV